MEAFPPITAPAVGALASTVGPAPSRCDALGRWMIACGPARPPAIGVDAPLVPLAIIAGDHGIADAVAGVSALPPNYSADLAAAVRSGESAATLVADAQPIAVTCEDAGGLAPARSVDRESGVTSEEYAEAFSRGIALADGWADRGLPLVAVGDAGRGLTTVAAAIIGATCGVEPVRVVGRGSGVDDAGWKAKVAAIRDAMYRVRDDKHDPERILRTIGSASLVLTTAVLAQAAVRRTPVILDGVGVLASAVCAEILAPGARAWWQVAAGSSEPAHAVALRRLALEPILAEGPRGGAGVSAALAVPLALATGRLARGIPSPEPDTAPASNGEADATGV